MSRLRLWKQESLRKPRAMEWHESRPMVDTTLAMTEDVPTGSACHQRPRCCHARPRIGRERLQEAAGKGSMRDPRGKTPSPNGRDLSKHQAEREMRAVDWTKRCNVPGSWLQVCTRDVPRNRQVQAESPARAPPSGAYARCQGSPCTAGEHHGIDDTLVGGCWC